jgi:outer membrane protein insertion porin family
MTVAAHMRSAVSAFVVATGLWSGTSAIALLSSATIAEAAVVRSIDVRGNQRVDDTTVRSYVNIEPGKNFSSADIDEGVKRLFATGLFRDVRVFQSGSTLVIEVDEYSVVNQVLFQGNRKVKDPSLEAVIKMQPRSVYSEDAVQADVEAIKEAYRKVGRSDVTVTPDVVDLGENRVNVVYQITEGDRTKISSISFVGNNAFGDRRLSQVVSTKRSNILSILFRDDVYDEDRLRADEEALRRFYYDRGYADFQVVSSTAELDEGSNSYTIVFTVEEGDRYTFGDVTIDSTVTGIDADELYSLVETRKGKTYSASDVEDTIIALTERVAGNGFAFAQVTPRGDRDFSNRTINVTYTIDQGTRAYIERIEIRGNDRTRDYVIRREFDVAEGDAFNQVLIQRAKKRLDALDFFERVAISTAPGSEADRVIVIVDVVEKSTGEFSIGAGYTVGGENDGPQFEGSITERNFLGRGQFIRFAIGAGEDNRSYNFSFTEPYFLGYRIAAGFDIFKKTRSTTYYDTESTGGTVRFGLPITNALSTQLAYNYSEETYTRTAAGTLPSAIQDAINRSATDPWVKSSVSASLTYNTIDDMKSPHEGIFAKTTLEYAGIGGDANFFSVTGRATGYKTLSEELDIVGLVTVGGGHISGIGDGLRAFDLFRSSSGIIRGFESNGIGPFDAAPGIVGERQIGGTSYVHATAEVQFPMPVVPENIGLRNALFIDAASVFGKNDNIGAAVTGDEFNIRSSVGASIIWASPFGPLRLDYAVPIAKEDSDRTQNINFGIATKF